MRVTIIKDDNAVYVSGEALTVDCTGLPANVHAIQWYDTHGEIEIIDPTKPYHYCIANQPITDFTPYQSYVDNWNSTKAALVAAAAAKPASSPAPSPTTTTVVVS